MPPQVMYPFAINSPLIQLSPLQLGPPSQTWNLSYSNISSSTFVPGMYGLGQASYTTTLQGHTGARFDFQFVGTGVSVLGSAGYYDSLLWGVDDVAFNPGGNAANQDMGVGGQSELAWARNLEWGLHHCTLIVSMTNDKVVLSGVIVMTGIQG